MTPSFWIPATRRIRASNAWCAGTTKVQQRHNKAQQAQQGTTRHNKAQQGTTMAQQWHNKVSHFLWVFLAGGRFTCNLFPPTARSSSLHSDSDPIINQIGQQPWPAAPHGHPNHPKTHQHRYQRLSDRRQCHRHRFSGHSGQNHRRGCPTAPQVHERCDGILHHL